MEFLQSNILTTGTKFTISDKIKNNSHIPGSIGFISHVSNLDDSYQNVVNIITILTRKGKTGKDRLEHCRLKIPVFTFDTKNFSKILPTVEVRRNFVYINKEEEGSYTNLMETTDLDFFGWACAMTNKLKAMSGKCKHNKWPQNSKHPINKMHRLPGCFAEEQAIDYDHYGSSEYRSSFLKEARIMYSSMVKIHFEMDRLEALYESNASEFLEYTNKGKFLEKKNTKNEYEFTDDNALLERTSKHYRIIKENADKLCVTKKIK